MQLQAAQVLESVVPAVRSRDGGDTNTGSRSFWELLAEHGPDRAGSKVRNAIQQDPEAATVAAIEAAAQSERSRAGLGVEAEGGVAQGEAAEAAEQNAHSIAAAILADLQPLTIGTLNQQILRADPRVLQRAAASADGGGGGRSAQSTDAHQEVGSQSRPHRAEGDQQRSESRNPQPSELPREEPVGATNRQSDVAINRGRESGGPPDAETTGRLPETQARATSSASHARAGQPVAAVAAAATAPPAPRAVEPLAARPPQAASPAAAIAGAAGRKAGGDAHMPRWDAQKPASAGTRAASNERQAALVASQLARGMAVALSRADGALTLRLNPGSLGFVRIRMEVENGTLHARFEASTDQARRLLDQSSETLRASLEAKGWESSRVRVDLLREADPAVEMLRRLEQQAESRPERFAAEDPAAESDSGAGTSGGDRELSQSKPGFSTHGRESELGAEPDQPEGSSAVGGVMMVSSSRVDTIA